MQLYAFDTNNCRKSVHNAAKKQDFFCMECGQVVRRRSGLLMQPHFYHLNPKKKCSMENKSLEHIEIQKKIVTTIGENKAEQEVRFLEISRVADVCWHEKQIVFEVQCSPITLEELVQRTGDYEKVGYYVIWILLDSTFLYKDKTAVREYLEKERTILQQKEAIIFDYIPGIYNAVRAFTVDVSTIEPFRKKECQKRIKKTSQ